MTISKMKFSMRLIATALFVIGLAGIVSVNALAAEEPTANNAAKKDGAAASSQATTTSAKQDEETAQQSEEERDTQKLRAEAFTKMAGSVMPLSPAEIHRLRSIYNAVQRASADPAGPPPKPTAVSRIVNLEPGAVPPIARLSAGFITSIVFLDSTGAPWPIKAYDLGDPKSFNIQWDKKGNTLLIQAITSYQRANLAVMLRGLNTPVMLTLVPGQRAVDYRIDMQVPRLGPNAQAGSVMSLPAGADHRLLDVLNGIPPHAAKTLKVDGGRGEAWAVRKKMFLRTPLTVISPGWFAKMSSSDGVIHAYMLPRVPVVLALQNGRMIKLMMKGL